MVNFLQQRNDENTGELCVRARVWACFSAQEQKHTTEQASQQASKEVVRKCM